MVERNKLRHFKHPLYDLQKVFFSSPRSISYLLRSCDHHRSRMSIDGACKTSENKKVIKVSISEIVATALFCCKEERISTEANK